jgi:hypothetical protein
MEDRETSRIYKHGEMRNDSNYEVKRKSRDFRRGTYEITGLLIFAGQSVSCLTSIGNLKLRHKSENIQVKSMKIIKGQVVPVQLVKAYEGLWIILNSTLVNKLRY